MTQSTILTAHNANGATLTRWQSPSTYPLNVAREVQRNLSAPGVDGIVVAGFGIVRGGGNAMRWMGTDSDGAAVFVTGDVYALAAAIGS